MSSLLMKKMKFYSIIQKTTLQNPEF